MGRLGNTSVADGGGVRGFHALRSWIGALLVWLLVAAAVRGQLWTVCPSSCDSTTIAGAVSGASPGDTILVMASPHTEANILIDRDLTVEGLGEMATIVQATVPAGPALGRVFDVPAGVSATLRKMTVRNGYVSSDGGGIRNLGALELVDVGVESSVAEFGSGGGIYNDGSLVMKGGRINGNVATHGGGLGNSGTASLMQTHVEGNQASPPLLSGAARGGGIMNTGTLYLIQGEVLENSVLTVDPTMSGGGIYTSSCDLVIVGGRVSGNQSSNFVGFYGGGIAIEPPMPCSVPVEVHGAVISHNRGHYGAGIWGGADSWLSVVDSTLAQNIGYGGGALLLFQSTASISESLIESNEAQVGGGLYVSIASASLRNVSLSGNRADDDGGAILAEYVGYPTLVRLSNVTVTGNVADDDLDGDGEGGGLFVQVGASVEMSNSIVTGNVDATPPSLISSPDCSGTIQSFGHNLIGTLGTSPFNHPCALVPDATSSGGDLVGADAKLGPLADNGGPTRTHALLPGSAAIDSADPSGCFELSDQLVLPLIPWDQRGAARDSLCDRGAFEANAVPAKLFSDGFERGATALWSATVF